MGEAGCGCRGGIFCCVGVLDAVALVVTGVAGGAERVVVRRLVEGSRGFEFACGWARGRGARGRGEGMGARGKYRFMKLMK